MIVFLRGVAGGLDTQFAAHAEVHDPRVRVVKREAEVRADGVAGGVLGIGGDEVRGSLRRHPRRCVRVIQLVRLDLVARIVLRVHVFPLLLRLST